MRELSLVVLIVEVRALGINMRCCPGGIRLLHFLLQIFVFGGQKSVTDRPARDPEYVEKGADSHLQSHVSGIVGLLLQKCRKK